MGGQDFIVLNKPGGCEPATVLGTVSEADAWLRLPDRVCGLGIGVLVGYGPMSRRERSVNVLGDRYAKDRPKRNL